MGKAEIILAGIKSKNVLSTVLAVARCGRRNSPIALHRDDMKFPTSCIPEEESCRPCFLVCTIAAQLGLPPVTLETADLMVPA